MPRLKEFDEQAVLEKALNVFWCKGYYATSAQDLVDELGISRSSLYDTFGDKRTLFIKALQLYRSEMAGNMIKMIRDSAQIDTTITQLLKMAVNEALSDKLSRGCFMVNTTIELAPHDDEVQAIVKQNMADIEDALNKAIRKGQQQGVFTTKLSSASLASFLFNSISGLRVAAKAGTARRVFDDVVKVTLSALKEN